MEDRTVVPKVIAGFRKRKLRYIAGYSEDSPCRFAKPCLAILESGRRNI